MLLLLVVLTAVHVPVFPLGLAGQRHHPVPAGPAPVAVPDPPIKESGGQRGRRARNRERRQRLVHPTDHDPRLVVPLHDVAALAEHVGKIPGQEGESDEPND